MWRNQIKRSRPEGGETKMMVEPNGIGRAKKERSAVPAAIHSEWDLSVGGSACLGPPARFGSGPRVARAVNRR